MTRRRTPVIVGVLAVASLVTSCSGSDGADPAAPLESTEPITAPPSSDQPPPTTEPPATTSAASTSTTTTAPPTTTTEPAPTTTTLEDLRQEIEDDLNAGEQALALSLETPGDVNAVASLAAYFSGGSLGAVEGIHERLVLEGLVGRPSSEFRSFHEVAEVVSHEENLAEILNCRIDAGVLVRPLADGSEEVVDDEVVRYVSRNTVVLSDGIWKLDGGETLTRTEGDPTCTSET